MTRGDKGDILKESGGDPTTHKQMTKAFAAKASVLTADELITLGRQLLQIDAPGALFDQIIDIVFDRDGEAEAERVSEAIFA